RLSRRDRVAQQREVSRRRVVEALEAVAVHGGVGRRSLGDDDVTQGEALGEGPAAADTDQLLHGILPDQLVDIDGQGGLPHPGALNRHPLTAVGAREPERASDLVVALVVFEEVLRDPLRPQRISGQEDAGGDLARRGGDVSAHGEKYDGAGAEVRWSRRAKPLRKG